MRLAGARITVTDLAKVGEAMDREMEGLRSAGYRPFYIWGGGHCANGTLAYYEAVRELKSQIEALDIHEPDFIIVASGTGSTHAGLHLGAACFLEDCTVIGVSVARNRERGQKVVEQSATELATDLNLTNLKEMEVAFRDEFMGRGYGDPLPEVASTIRRVLQAEALALDPVYTGKAFFGLETMVEKGQVPEGSHVVFWHTGGLINLLSASQSALGTVESP